MNKNVEQTPARLNFMGNTALVSLTTIGADSLNPLPEGTYNILVPDVLIIKTIRHNTNLRTLL